MLGPPRLVRQGTALLPHLANIRVGVGWCLPPHKMLTPDMTRKILGGSPFFIRNLVFCTLTTAPQTEKILKLLRLSPGDGGNGPL